MTINTQMRSAGPFAGNGSASAFPFMFKVFQRSDVLAQVIVAGGDASVLVLDLDYTVTLNPDQNAAPGGTILLAAPLAVGVSLTLMGNLPLTQPARLTNLGGFFPQTIEDALDRLTILIQQSLLSIGRTLQAPEIGQDMMLPAADVRAGKLLGFSTPDGAPIAVLPTAGDATGLALDLASKSSGAKGAGQLGYAAALAYAPGTVGDRLRREVWPEDYPTIQHALTAAKATRAELVLRPGATYTISAPLVDCDVTIRGNGATIDMSGLGASDTGLSASGVEAVPTSLTANAAAGATSITVASAAGITAGTWLYLKSNAVFSAGEGVTYGEWARALSVAGNTISLYAPTIYAYATADAASCAAVAVVGDFTWSDLTIRGSGTGSQNGARLSRAAGVQLRNVSTDRCNARGISLERCIGVDVRGGMMQRANAPGISYGIIIYNGCTGISIAGVTGHDLRHAVTIGGTSGINRGIQVAQCQALSARDGGFDCHSGGDGILFSQLYVECASTSLDGVVMQGINYTLRDIEVRNAGRHCVLAQWLCNYPGSGIISGVRGTAAQTIVSADASGWDISALSIEDVIGVAPVALVSVSAQAGRAVRRVSTSRVRSAGNLAQRAVRYLASGAGALISSGSISDVDVNMASGALECIYLQCVGGGVVENIAVESCRTSGGTYGLRLLDATNISVGTMNRFDAATTSPMIWGAGAGNRGGLFTGSAAYDPPNLADGAGVTTTVAVTGATLGDVASASYSLDLAGVTLTAWVSADNVVSVRFQNESGAAIDLAAGTLRACVSRVTS